MSLFHSFAYTKDYAIVFEAPYYIAMSPDVLYKSMSAINLITNDVNGTTKIHVIRLSDGEVTTLDSGIWAMILHYGNSYQPNEDTIVVEGPAYEKPDGNPFRIWENENKLEASSMTGYQFGSVWKKFIIDLKTQTVTMEDLLHSEYGSLDLAAYNPRYEGVAENRYSYLFQLFHQTKIDEHYHWPIHKFDAEKKSIVGTWGPPMTLCQEPRFIANPNGVDEEDGIILTTTYNFYEKKSSVVVIDPRTMETL